MKTAADFTSPPSDYHVIVPDGWFQLLLDPDERDRGIVALADRQFRGVDNAPHLKKELMRGLQRKAKDAYAVGGMELYLSTIVLGPLPLASSLLISMPAPDAMPSCSNAEELAGLLADRPSADVTVRELEAAGWAVRRRGEEAADPAAQMGNTLTTTTLVYYVPIPATTRWLVLNFSTPMESLADRMVELFDTVAGTLYWE
ncbi:hypothetical protein [Streptomyces tsukubensis]|uniref:Uncharacterized protein n=1 Tax=Streptomyces tsukubensis TaxID=83656 RepID=A0A1V4A8G7_9ACTN|nr:hypothetical protein [Streptomyces tsukubensis]OON78393.1 hypothetical protein B1H18_16535 [Streptomyces tsukubensis]QFR95157.1 hypothetical protein GBW32_21695 [Streptomyces tsukubensis]